MQKKFKLSLCQFKVSQDKSSNIEKAEYFIKTTISEHNPDIIILPEYFNCPAGMNLTSKYAEYESNSKTLKIISTLAAQYKTYIIAGSIPLKDEQSEEYFNTSFVYNRKGENIAKHSKVHLFDVDIPGKITYKESNNISRGNKFTYFDTEFCRIGLGICYDIRFPEYSQILKKNYNVDLLVFPAAFNTVTGPMHWELLQRSRALDNNVFVAMCSPARNSENKDRYQCYGFSSVCDPFGRVIAMAGYEEEILVVEIDLKKNRDIEQQIPTLKQKRDDMYEIFQKPKF